MVKEMIYVVRFIRKDGKPDENYYYQSLKDAEYHFHLFNDDNSGLYRTILLLEWDGNAIVPKETIEY